MPRKKRWFPFNHDFNDDGQLWEFTDKFGDRSIRIWMEICAILDKTENHWEMTESSCRAVLRKARCRLATGWPAISWLVANQWLMVSQSVSNPQLTIYGSPNYWKYHPKAEPDKFLCDSLLPSFLPSALKKEPKTPPSAAPQKGKEPERHPEKKTDFEPLVKMAAELGGKDMQASQKFVQWTLSMVKTLKREPPERTAAVIRNSLEIVKQKLANGYTITSVWGLLTTIFDKERTKYMQGPENESYKHIEIDPKVKSLTQGIG